ncbi:MAG: rhodanese-like domain-containing protein [Brumimicrobium sp.]|nr:rhodanese-like domain-containing protein [Brumimicrobium sp.]
MKLLSHSITLIFGILLFGQCFAQEAANDDQVIKRVSKEEFKKALESGEYIVFDVRSEEEYMAGHIKGAKLLDVNDPNFEATLQNVPKERKYLIYCQSGGRSQIALEKMKEMGFKRVLELQGGYTNWTR